MTDVDLSAVDRHETVLQRRISILVVVVLLLAGAVAALGYRLNTGVNLSAENRCLTAADIRFLGAVVATLAEGNDDTVDELLAVARKLDIAILAGEDPCLLNIPPIGPP